MPIDDPDDPRLVDYRDLTDAELRARREADEGLFVAEGVHVIRRLVRSAYPVRSVLVAPRKLEALREDLAGLTAPVYVASQDVLNRVVGFNIHRGAVAVAGRLAPQRAEAVAANAARVVVVEGMTDQENLGLIFRNAAGLGIDAVLLCPRTCDPLYRRTVRVSMGHVLATPHARFVRWPHGLDDLNAAGFKTVALTPDPSAVDLDAVDPRPTDKVAILVGAEGPGLTPGAMARAGVRVRIPMAAGVDSLNVAAAAAIAFHHFRPPNLRQ